YLLDRGVRSWPAPAEIRVYETLPGAELGHLAQGEAGGAPSRPGGGQGGGIQPPPPGDAGPPVRGPRPGPPAIPRPPRARPFRPPASRAATQLAPRSPPGRVPGGPSWRGRRAAGPAGLPPRVRRPRRRVGFALILTGSSPQLRVRLRLSERQGQELAAKLT